MLPLSSGHSEAALKGLRKTPQDPFREAPQLELNSEWDSLGPSSSVQEGDHWDKDLFHAVPLAFDLVYTQEGQERTNLQLDSTLRKTLEDRQFRVLSSAEDPRIADFYLRIEVDVTVFQNTWQKYVRVVATSDFTLEERHRDQRQYHLTGPVQEGYGGDAEAAIAQMNKRLTRDLVMTIRDKLRIQR